MLLGSEPVPGRCTQLIDIVECVSPNFGPRKNGLRLSLVVLHYTAMQDAAGAIDWLCTPAAQVSAHYVIARSGAVTRLVPEEMRAWHAGRGSWGDCDDVNSASIGIELDNDGFSPFAAPLMDSLTVLLQDIFARWDLPPKAVIGHSDLAPGRKIDPGPRFDWRRLARAGVSVWPERVQMGQAPNPEQFAANLTRFGMTADTDADTRLAMFRARFRPRHSGPLAREDMALAQALAAQWPVDPIGRSG